MSFVTDTYVEPDDIGFKATIHDGWGVAGNANGGYLMALGARAMAAASKPCPVAVTAHFLAPGRPGPVHIDTTVLKTGSRFSTVRATLASDDKPLVELLGSFTDLRGEQGPVRIDSEPPDLPPPGQCVRLEPGPSDFPPPMLAHVDMRLHPDDALFSSGKPTGRPLFRGWVRLHDEPIDAFGLLFIVDAFPPTIFNAHLPVAWTPTLELNAHVRGVPESGWLRCRFSTSFITGGLLEEDGEVWDESGRLVAQSRQLALLPRG